jgi:hypothetical protein
MLKTLLWAAILASISFVLACEPKEVTDCRLSVPRTQLDVVVFSTLERLKEFDRAIVNEDTAAATAVLRSNAGYDVPRSTRCSKLDLSGDVGELQYAKVRILDGAFAGRVGWVPAGHTAGN